MHGYDMTTLLPLDVYKGLLVPKWDSDRNGPVCPFCSGSGIGATAVTIAGVSKRFEPLSGANQRPGIEGALLAQTGVRMALSRIVMLTDRNILMPDLEHIGVAKEVRDGELL